MTTATDDRRYLKPIEIDANVMPNARKLADPLALTVKKYSVMPSGSPATCRSPIA